MFASDHYHVIGEAIGFNDETNLLDKIDQLDRPAIDKRATQPKRDVHVEQKFQAARALPTAT